MLAEAPSGDEASGAAVRALCLRLLLARQVHRTLEPSDERQQSNAELSTAYEPQAYPAGDRLCDYPL